MIIGVVRNHHKELALISFSITLWNQHVLRPSTSTEVELSKLISSFWAICVVISEGTVKWNGHRWLSGWSRYNILARSHWEIKGSFVTTHPYWSQEYSQFTSNLSNSTNKFFWSLNSHGLPLSSNLGARKILHVPLLVPPWLLTVIL